jgi:hypothetical protein
MRNDLRTITCVINCDSPETLRTAEQLARAETSPRKVFVEVAKTLPGGVESRTIRYHTLRDYFDTVQVLTDGSTSLRLVFHIKDDADSYWKDLMVRVLHFVRGSVPGIEVASITRSA